MVLRKAGGDAGSAELVVACCNPALRHAPLLSRLVLLLMAPPRGFMLLLLVLFGASPSSGLVGTNRPLLIRGGWRDLERAEDASAVCRLVACVSSPSLEGAVT